MWDALTNPDVTVNYWGNTRIESGWQRGSAVRYVRDGQTMSAPLERHPIFPAMVTQMMQVGEETGQMSAMLDKVSDFYDHEVETATESLTAAIEPLMVVVMGAMIGLMVVCLYLPMFTIYQHIQGS